MTLSDNVFLRPSGQESADVVTSLTPSIGLKGRGGRLSLDLSYAPTVVKYLNNASSDTIRQNLNALATLEAVNDFLFIDGRASIYQNLITPLGPVPSDQAVITENRSEAVTAGISPYVQRRTSSGSTYGFRNDTSYSTLISSSQSANTTQSGNFANRFTADYNGPPGTAVVFSASYLNGYYHFANSPSSNLQVARGRLTMPFDPGTSIFLIGGYESNDIVVGGYAGPVYGGGATWSPTPRTNILALAEKRFFGTGYNATFNHRTRATTWSLRASNDVQQFGATGIRNSTLETRDLVDNLFLSSIPDPIARQQAVDQFIRQTGLPQFVNIPTNFYSTRINQIEAIDASFGLIGVRNSLVFGLFYRKTTPVNVASNSGLPDVFNTFSTTTQRGFSINFSHKLSEQLSLGGGLNRINGEGTGVGSLGVPVPPTVTHQIIYRANLTRQFSPKTFGSVTVRHQNFDTTASGDFRETAVVISASHAFY